MQIVKRILVAVLLLLVLLAVLGGTFVFLQKPSYDGEEHLARLSGEVKVYYDPYGIPHIYAQNEKDAFRALGYVHAQDRLWQMELLRRIGRGGLSELFGKDLIRTDQFFMALGIDEASEKTIVTLDLDSPGVQLTQAYLDGINEFVEQGPTPLEFYLTGIDKEPFVLKDVYNVMGYMAFSFAMAHKTDPLLTRIREKLGPRYLNDLAVHSDTSTIWLKNHPRDSAETLAEDRLTAGIFETLDKWNIPQFEGSNSWVLGPQKTKAGR